MIVSTDSPVGTKIWPPYPSGMLVGLQSQVEHLASLVALLVHQLVADGQQSGETRFNDVVKVLAVIGVGRFVTERTADGQQTLQTSEDGAGSICVEKLEGEVHKSRPSRGKVILENALQNRDKLLTDEALGGSENGQQSISDAGLFLFGDELRGFARVGVCVVPRSVDSVFDINYS